MQKAFSETLHTIGVMDKRIVLIDAGQSAFLKNQLFAKAYPARYFNAGLSPKNAICMAAGFARAGKIPFIGGHVDTLLGQGFEQIRANIAHHALLVKIFAVYPSNKPNIDINLMRSLGGMKIFSPADEIEARQVLRVAAGLLEPCYIRLMDSANPPVIYDKNYEFRIGKGSMLLDGDDVGIISTGAVTCDVLQVANRLKNIGISVRLVNMCSLAPVDTDLIIETARKVKLFITTENHATSGLGGIVSQILSEYFPRKLCRISAKGDLDEIYNQIVDFIKQT